MATFASTLKDLRKQKGYTQPELAEKLGISRSAVSMYEQAKREPDLATLKRIAAFFDVDLDRLTGNEATATAPVEMDDFTYALFNESQELTEENQQKLLEMARFFKSRQDENQ